MTSFIKTSFLFSLITLCTFTYTQAATVEVKNNCPYKVWAAAVPGGGKPLNTGESWTITASAGTQKARVWARTGCNFDNSGNGHCQTGDCGGVLNCQAYGSCGATDYSRYFKTRCPDAYSYPKDDATSTFTCPGGTTNYRVVFCP
ncbi:unnamed protein product [Vicia faba]|uniref:Thaumatin-like protein n=1 Tax=Vicia faba TaxID=3906 RepID=A0AAV1BAL7_VICFA|nr:unnamed protein product [Vicia faba]